MHIFCNYKMFKLPYDLHEMHVTMTWLGCCARVVGFASSCISAQDDASNNNNNIDNNNNNNSNDDNDNYDNNNNNNNNNNYAFQLMTS